MKKTKVSVIIIYCLAIFLLFLPFLKQAILIYQTKNVTVQQVTNLKKIDQVNLEAVQPSDLTDILTFDENQVFQSIGQVVIPKTKISVPIFAGLSENEMLIGGGTLYPERCAEKENIVILGHHLGRDELLFGKLLGLTVGETIYLDYFGSYYQYTITQTKLIKETELAVLSNHNKAEITLITCDTAAPTDKRFVVVGQLQQTKKTQEIETIIQQKTQIEKSHQTKNWLYLFFVLMLFLVMMFAGIIVLNKLIS